MKLSIMVATWLIVCWTIVVGSPIAFASPAEITYPSVFFNASSGDVIAYMIFVDQLRQGLKGDVVSHGIPVLPTQVPITSDKRFFFVELESYGYHVQLALDVISANIVAFSAGSNAYFFNDVSRCVFKSQLFKDKTRNVLPFGGSYGRLEIAGAYREKIGLGITAFKETIIKLADYPNHPDNTEIAPSLLIAIQMVSEAARLQLVFNTIVTHFHVGFVPGGEIISYETYWTVLSTAIQTSDDEGKFPPIQLLYDTLKPQIVSSVEQVKDEIGLLQGELCIVTDPLTV